MCIITIHILDNSGVEYIIKHNRNSAAFTCEEVAQERGVTLSQILKCMVGKDSDEIIYVMLISGDKKLNIKEVRKLAGGKKIVLFPRDELAEKFGLIVGAINPIQFLGKAMFYLDETILNEEYIDISSGSPNAGIELKTNDLIKLISPTICNIGKTI